MTDSGQATKKMKQDESIVDSTTQSDEIGALNAYLLKNANQALQDSNKLHVRPIIDETRLGIELFVGDIKDEFHGLIKTRYADFIVHEIDLDGKIARLTTLELPDEQEVTDSVSLSDFLDSKALECMSDVNNGYLNQYRIDVTGMDKNTRTSLHHAIRGAFDRLESSTISESEVIKNENQQDEKSEEINCVQQVEDKSSNDPEQNGITTADESNRSSDKKYIVVTRRNKVSRPKNTWPRDRPDHTHFILYKENKDTMEAIHNLAAAINTRPSNFSYAGVKDRRAVTSQWLSSWRLEPRRLVAASRRFNKRPFLKVGNFCFKKEPLKLGQLKANKFDIVIRHLVHNSKGVKVIEEAMKSIKVNGFVNYFGLQRFGTRSIQTHDIGLAILQSKWDKAIDLILSYRFDDNMQPLATPRNNSAENTTCNNELGDSSVESQKIDRPRSDNKSWAHGAEQHNSFIDLWKSKLDAEVVFRKYPHFRFTNEGLLMKSLSKSEDSSRDYLNALISLPKNTRSIYVHSYQSLLWNRAATFRLKEYGFEVVPGDLILSAETNISDNSLDILLNADEIEPADASATKSTDQNSNGTRRVPIEEIDSKIVIADASNVKNYSIFDVVLPIVGSRVRIPENSVGQEIKRLLDDDNLTLESFKAREKLFISYGSYRKVMVRPNNVNWRIEQYSNPKQNLIETDLEKLNRESIVGNKEGHDRPPSPLKSDSSDEALVVEFELPPSSYATMCLREIMKKPSTNFNSRF